MSEEEIEITIDPIHTSCKDCVFAIYKDSTQTGCAINMIERYKSKDCSIIEAYDEDKEFYILNKYKCIGHRTESWFNQYSDVEDTLEYKIRKVKESNYLNYLLLIDLKSITVENLENIFKDIANLVVKPKKIILIRYSYTNKVFDFDLIQSLMKKYSIVCSWRIQTMLEENIELRSILSSTININKSNRFMLYITDYSTKMKDALEKGNKIAFDELDSFSLITDADHKISLFSTIVYRYMWFLEGKDILTVDTDTIII
jgi:hypothetical protein